MAYSWVALGVGGFATGVDIAIARFDEGIRCVCGVLNGVRSGSSQLNRLVTRGEPQLNDALVVRMMVLTVNGHDL